MVASSLLPTRLDPVHEAERAGVLLDAISLAQEAPSLRRLVAQVAPDLARIFSPEVVAALVLGRAVASQIAAETGELAAFGPAASPDPRPSPFGTDAVGPWSRRRFPCLA
jgi:hypothetical protein